MHGALRCMLRSRIPTEHLDNAVVVPGCPGKASIFVGSHVPARRSVVFPLFCVHGTTANLCFHTSGACVTKTRRHLFKVKLGRKAQLREEEIFLPSDWERKSALCLCADRHDGVK